MAGEAAGVPDGALAAELLEQPRGAEIRVLDLVVVQVPRVRVRDVRVDRDRHDALGVGLGEGRVQRVGIVRVEDDRVDVLRDQRAQVGQLSSSVRVAVNDGDPCDLVLAQGSTLGLRGADLLLAEAVADAAAVGVADRVRGFRSGARSARARGARRRDDPDGRETDEQPHDCRCLGHSFSSICDRRADLVAPPLLPTPCADGDRSMRTNGRTSCAEFTLPTLLPGDGASNPPAHAHGRRFRRGPASARRLPPMPG